MNPVELFTVSYGADNFNYDFLDKFRQYGVCVVKNVFSEQECDSHIEEVVSSIEKLGSGVDRNKPETWTNENLPSQVRPGMYQSDTKLCFVIDAINKVAVDFM